MRLGTSAVAAALCGLLALAFAAPAASGAGSVYWGAGTTGVGAIRLGNLDGTGGASSLFTGESAPGGIAIDPAAGKIYWTNATAHEVRVANLDGTGTASSLFTGETDPHGVAIDPAAGKIYWAIDNAAPGAGAIRVGNLDGSGSPTNLYTGQNFPEGIAIDPAAGKIYWANSTSGEIQEGNLDGSGSPTTLFSGESAARGVAIDPAAGKIYWVIGNGAIPVGNIRVGNLDGSGSPTTLYTGEGNPRGIAIDPAAGKIYWVDNNPGEVRVGAIDGSAPASTLYGGESVPLLPLALLQSPLGTAPPTVSGAGQLGSELSCGQGGWAADLPTALLYRAPRTLAYQWQRNGADLAAATAATFTPTTPGEYRCRVSAANQAGQTSQTSAPVTVTAPAPPPSCPQAAPAPSNYTPSRKVRARQVPGVRVRIAVDAPAQLEIEATLSFKRGGRARSVDLGSHSLGNPGTRNLRLPLPGSLRGALPLGASVRLRLTISATTGCGEPQRSEQTVRTRVVKVLAGP